MWFGFLSTLEATFFTYFLPMFTILVIPIYMKNAVGEYNINKVIKSQRFDYQS
jgi:hypothetical protein